MHPVGTEHVDRDRGAERRSMPPGKPEHHARKAVLGDVVAKPEHASRIVGLVAFLDHFERRLAAAPASPSFSQTVSATASRNAGIWQASEPSALTTKEAPSKTSSSWPQIWLR